MECSIDVNNACGYMDLSNLDYTSLVGPDGQ